MYLLNLVRSGSPVRNKAQRDHARIHAQNTPCPKTVRSLPDERAAREEEIDVLGLLRLLHIHTGICIDLDLHVLEISRTAVPVVVVSS